MNKNYKLFKFIDIFDYERGKRFTEKEQIPGDIAYISSTKLNNGIKNYVTPPKKNLKGSNIKIFNNCLTLSNSGSVGVLFYHDYDFVASDHVTVIWLKDINIKLNKYIALYLKPIFESIKYKYNFGREISNPNLEKEYIRLPIDEDEKPDWKYMEDYIKSLEINIKFEKIKTINNEKNFCNLNNWQEFNLIDYFSMETGEYVPAEKYNEGQTPYISSAATNNGVMCYCDLEPSFNTPCITIGKIDMPVFYQEKPFIMTCDSTALIPKSNVIFNKYTALFLCSVLKQDSYKWRYGRQIRWSDCIQLSINLPAIKLSNGTYEPNWQYMEDYIKALPYADLL